MRRSRQALVVVFLVFIVTLSVYYADLGDFCPERGFVCPIPHDEDIIIRNDDIGEGDFGTRRRGGRKHKGIDLEAPIGTPIRAARTGKVIETGNHPSGYGKYVEMRHPDGFITIYAHLSEIDVREGKIVHRGKIIGKVGKSGNASHRLIKSHVHFEIRDDGVPVNPMDYIQSEERGMHPVKKNIISFVRDHLP